jgi:hypothetical protein
MKKPGRRTSSTERVDDADLVGSSRRRAAKKQSALVGPVRFLRDPSVESSDLLAPHLREREVAPRP